MRQTYLKNVVTLGLNPDLCIGCGLCREVCPHDVFDLGSGRAELRDRDACMECGACARNCPSEAITVRAGVGCAYAIAIGMLKGTEPTCGD
ncbi:MAG TPA: mercury methylation ferredoxin HgcB [Acidobacteriota bacterium]|nr:mercury methylation ferredoxin HgcB [Acidobacteriota bacterium]